GQVLGIAQFGNTAGYHAFIHTPGSGSIDLDASVSGEAIAQGLNQAGQAVGWLNINGAFHAFLYSGGTTLDLNATLASVLGATESEAQAINSHGHVVGSYFTGTSPNEQRHGFIYRNGTATDLGTLGGTWTPTRTVGWAINDQDEVVGWSATPSG